MTSPFQVNPASLRRHAVRLDAVAEELSALRRAGDSAGPGRESFGRLCVIVPLMLDGLRFPLTRAMGSAAESVRGTADALIGAAADYEYADETAAGTLTSGD